MNYNINGISYSNDFVEYGFYFIEEVETCIFHERDVRNEIHRHTW